MVRNTKLMEVPKNELLYDEARLNDICDRLEEDGIPPKPTEIKENIKTEATIYEIRTAWRYWNGQNATHRTSDRIWQKCKAVDDGQYALVGAELKYADDVEV